MSESLWDARMFADKTIKCAVQKEIKMLALVVLGNNKLTIDYKEDGFDSYPSCKNWEKSYCPVEGKKKRYAGRFCEYVVFGTTHTDVYLEVLRLLANDMSLYVPIVSWKTSEVEE